MHPSTIAHLNHMIWLAEQAIRIAKADSTLAPNVVPLTLHRDLRRAQQNLDDYKRRHGAKESA